MRAQDGTLMTNDSTVLVETVPAVRDRRSGLAKHYRDVRSLTEALAAPLSAEDQTVQSMPDASPTKWHRAHTTWFFETFVLVPHARGYRIFDEAFGFIFNSYYESVGPRHPRPSRGVLSRPGIDAVAAYRAYVDTAVERQLESADQNVVNLIMTGLHHGRMDHGQSGELGSASLLVPRRQGLAGLHAPRLAEPASRRTCLPRELL